MILRKKSVFSSISILSKKNLEKILEEFFVKKVVDGDSFSFTKLVVVTLSNYTLQS